MPPARASVVRPPIAATSTPPRRQRDQLRAVAKPVVGGECPSVKALRDALLDQRPGEHVLRPVAESADEPHGAAEPGDEPGRRQAEADSLHRDGDQGSKRQRLRGDPPRDDEGAEHHPDRPCPEDHAVDGVRHLQVLLEEEHLRRDRRRHEQQRDERNRHDQRQRAVAEQVHDAVARPVRLLAGARGGDGPAPRAQQEPAKATAANVPALTSIAASVPPKPASTPPINGPAVMPA